ncbi:MAG: DEAD/DEAH box helicase family protein, partial [Candidatus Lokiarchaeota archaeon]|nr:DEAD/DEAH box helicase family protein [Candidatus Lokiarchaeota archaeon]
GIILALGINSASCTESFAERFPQHARNVIGNINKFRNGFLEEPVLIESICSYFDKIKSKELSLNDLRFLKYISNTIGIPHYYDLLSKFNKDIKEIQTFDLNTFSSIFYESTLYKSSTIKVHKYQDEIIDKYFQGCLNRFFLSASTSFGKTFVVFEIIKKMNYDNVVLIFPTIALLSENLDRVTSNNDYKYFREKYDIHTLSEVNEIGERNLFIYTPERFLSFIEKTKNPIYFNFVFVDEVYKIDNEYLIDEKTRENERDVAYRLAIHYALRNDNTDILLAGPYIEINDSPEDSFNVFLETYQIKLLNYNKIETVNKKYSDIKNKKMIEIDTDIVIKFSNTQKTKRLIAILKVFEELVENSIIYCYSKSYTESCAKKIINSEINTNWDYTSYYDFLEHIKKNFTNNWVLLQALKRGIGIHHGLIPKYIQKEIITLFNLGRLSILISTTTITEGVNTSAKNLIVLHNKKGSKELKKFDAKNISGRAGRFLHHFSGRVIALQNKFMETITSEGETIKHKNFDIDSIKDEIDLFYTNDVYLNNVDKLLKQDILKQQQLRNIPEDIIKRFKVISRMDKIIIYDNIKNLSNEDRALIRQFIIKIQMSWGIEFKGLQVIINVIKPVVKNKKLDFLFNYEKSNNFDGNEYSIFIYLLHFFLRDGFIGSMNYKIDNGEKVDNAIRETSEFIYNILKYQAVKYLGVFNVMYKFIKSKEINKDIDDVTGIDKLLLKLEYNALTEKGRIASDYGVPYNILEYYENINMSNEIKSDFDNYEKKVFNKIEDIINNNL